MNLKRIAKRVKLPIAIVIAASTCAAVSALEQYGPPNLLRTMKTPFGAKAAGVADDVAENQLSLGAISLNPGGNSGSALSRRLGRNSLSTRLIPPKLYMPERPQLGEPARFTVEGKAGSKVAIAMAESNKGAQPINGHELKLGADRLVVAVGKIPASGVVELVIGTPIQGDLIGEKLFFEAAVWSMDDLSDAAIARPVSAAGATVRDNGVEVAAAPIQAKRGVRFVPEAAIPMNQRRSKGGSSLDTGQP